MIKLLLFLIPIITGITLELFVFPIDFFTFRVWEAIIKDTDNSLIPGYFYPNMQLDKIEQGDLGHHTPYAVNKSVKWITDRFGYRKRNITQPPEILIIGDSNTAGGALSQEELLSEVLEQKLDKIVYPLAPADVSAYSEHPYFQENTPGIVIFQRVERNIPELELVPVQNDEKHHFLLSKIEDTLKYNSRCQKVAILMDRFKKSIMLHKYRKQLRRYVNNLFRKQEILSEPMFFLQGDKFNNDSSEFKLNYAINVIMSYHHYFLKKNIRFIFLPIPDKENIYYYRMQSKKKPVFLFRLILELQKRNIEVIDTQRAFDHYNLTTNNLLFHLDDTHWNANAVNLTADLIVQRINK